MARRDLQGLWAPSKADGLAGGVRLFGCLVFCLQSQVMLRKAGGAPCKADGTPCKVGGAPCKAGGAPCKTDGPPCKAGGQLFVCLLAV